MCCIVDNSVVVELVSNCTPRSKTFLKLQLARKIRIATCGALKKEYGRNQDIIDFFGKIKRNGLLNDIDDDRIDAEKRAVGKANPKSNDLHVLALARVSGARVVATDDKALQKDIKNEKLLNDPKGKVFSKSGHGRLLSGGLCRPPG